MYNYILIIFLIIILYIITHEDFDSCKIKSCKSGYSLSLYSEKCCPSKDNVSSYNNTDCKILGCNAGYTLSDDKQSCCKNVVGDGINTVYNSNSTYDSSCIIKSCGVGIKNGNNCCMQQSGTSTYNSYTCKPTACSTNYKLSKSGDFCCYNNDTNATEYTNNGTSCSVSKCKDRYFLSNGYCYECGDGKFVSNDGKNCKNVVKGALTYLDNGDVGTCSDGYKYWNANTCDCSWNKENTIDDLLKMNYDAFKSYSYTQMIIFNIFLQQTGGDILQYYVDARGLKGMYKVLITFKRNNDNCKNELTNMVLGDVFNNNDPTKMFNVIPNEYKYIQIKIGNDFGYLDAGASNGTVIYLNKNFNTSSYTNKFIRWRYVNYHIINEETQKCISVSSDGNNVILEDYNNNSSTQIFELFDYVEIKNMFGGINEAVRPNNGVKSFVIKSTYNSKYIYTNNTFNLLLSDKCQKNQFLTSCSTMLDYYHWYQE